LEVKLNSGRPIVWYPKEHKNWDQTFNLYRHRNLR
jgi:hypothetical protein